MNTVFINFKEANNYLGWIIAVGIALGIANYSLGFWPTLGQSCVQQIIMSLVIGYSLLVVVSNVPKWFANQQPIAEYTFLFCIFIIIGCIGTEIENLVRSFLFQEGPYQFLGGGGTYLFNGILSVILGYGTYSFFQNKNRSIQNSSTDSDPAPEITNPPKLKDQIQNVPIKKGEVVTLFPVEEIIYFEAYDNYSFLFDIHGAKHLCNYSLGYLEKKLDDNFIRVHRKYILHRHQIVQIQPHLKGRFVISFKDQKKSSIISSASYTETIKALIKL